MLIVIRKSKLFVILAAIAMVIGAGIATEVSLSMSRPVQSEAAESNPQQHLVVIDAGHGGMDGGAVGESGVMEKDLNLKVAQKLKNALEQRGIKCIMTRDADVSIHDENKTTVRSQKRSDLQNRRKIIEESGCSMFISIHMNKFEQSQYKGAQVFYSKVNPKSSELAQSAKENLLAELKDDNKREIKKAENTVYLLKFTTMPAILVECGFLSNPEEEKLLQTDDYQNKIVAALCKTITDWYSSEAGENEQ